MSILLPGHNCGAREFWREGRADKWYDCVKAELDRCVERYDKIYLVGHSMGCLLSLCMCAEYGERITGALLICPALKINYLNRAANQTRRRVMRYAADNPIRATYRDARGVTGLRKSLYTACLRPCIEFLKIQKRAKKCLPSVKNDITAILSRRDETVSFKSADALKAGLCNANLTEIVLEESYHVYFPEDERAVVERELARLIGSSRLTIKNE